jgi:hypothetical protein
MASEFGLIFLQELGEVDPVGRIYFLGEEEIK